MPSLTDILSKPKYDRNAVYQVVAGFSLDLPGNPGFAPRIGSTLLGTHPAVVALYKAGAGEKFLLPADADSIAVAQARARAEEITYPEEPPADPGIPLARQRRCVNAIRRPAGTAILELVALGAILDQGDKLVHDFPDAFERVSA